MVERSTLGRRTKGRFAVAMLVLPVLAVAIVVWLDVFEFVRLPWPRNDVQDAVKAMEATRARPDDGLTRLRVLHQMEGGYAPSIAMSRFDPADLVSGSSYQQLEIAGLKSVHAYLQQYRATGDRANLRPAEQYLKDFLAYERRKVVPVGLLWNDHAIAERVYVASDLWDAMVRAGIAEESFAAEVLDAIERWSHYLASPSLYTVRTNHGVMQNLALMHAGIVFPTLGGSAQNWNTGRDRLLAQLAYYVSDEGVVSEHSTHYHAFGVYLLGVLQRYLSLRGEAVPESLRSKYEASRAFVAQIRRPDGSIPRVGNTGDDHVAEAMLTYDAATKAFTMLALPAVRSGCAWYPVSGYAIWRGADESGVDASDGHLTVAWPRFPGLGHFRPLDFSLTFWRNGTSWWTETGYWGQDDRMVRRVRSWDGTNAPHFTSEPGKAESDPRLVGYVCEQGLRFAELRRTASPQGEIRRQVMQLRKGEWLVIDSWRGNAVTFRERWTLDPGLSVEETAPRSFVARSTVDGDSMTVDFLGEQDLRVEMLVGSLDPFGGWIWVRGQARRTAAFLLESGAKEGWLATLWRTSAPGEDARPQMHWRSDSEWELRVPSGPRTVLFTRSDSRLDFDGVQATIASGPDVGTARRAMRVALDAEVSRLPEPHRLLLSYRWKISRLVVAAFAIQLVLYFLLRRYAPGRIAVVYGGAALWIAVALWLHFIYFVV